MTKEVVDDTRKVARKNRQTFESTNMRDCEKECFLGIEIFAKRFYTNLQGGGFRAFDVSAGFVDVTAVQVRPQRWTRDKNGPPATTHVGQRD